MTWLTFSVVLANAARFATHWLIAWQYGAQEHGRFTVVFQLISLVIVVGELGIITSFGVKKLALVAAQHRAGLSRIISDLGAVLLLVNAVFAAALWVFAGPISRGLQADAVLLRSVALWPVGFILYRLTVMVAGGLEDTTYAAKTTLLFYLGWLVWLMVALAGGLPIGVLYWGWSWLFLVTGLAGWGLMRPLLARHDIRCEPRLAGLSFVAQTVVGAAPYAVGHAGTILLGAMTCILFAYWDGSGQLSYLQIVYSLAMLVQVIAIPIANAMLPTITRLTVTLPGGDRTMFEVVRHVLRLLTALGTLAVGVWWVVGSWLLGYLGPTYAVRDVLLTALAVAATVDIHRIVFDQVLVANHRVGTVVKGELMRYGLLLIATVFLVPRWDIEGAVAAIMIALTGNWIFKGLVMAKTFGSAVWVEATKLGAILVLMAAVGWFMEAHWPVLLGWAAGVVLLGVVRRSDAGWVRAAVIQTNKN